MTGTRQKSKRLSIITLLLSALLAMTANGQSAEAGMGYVQDSLPELILLAGDQQNIAFAMCMAAGRDFNQCKNGLGFGQQGFGMCMAANRNFNECAKALGSNNIAFGICMAGQRLYTQCQEALTND